jgi:hypothetical protein
MENEKQDILKLSIYMMSVLLVIAAVGIVGSYYSEISPSVWAGGDECAVDSECGPCQECRDQYPDKPFEVLGCSDICASGEECIDDSCCPEERACDDVCCAAGKYSYDDECIECDPDEQPNECHECEGGDWDWECEEEKGDCGKRSGCDAGECVYEPDNSCCPPNHVCVPH